MSVWSPFAKTVTELVPLQENHSVTIQKLGWKALSDAAQESVSKGIEVAKKVGPGGLLKELNNQGGEEEVRKKVAADPFLQYDQETLLRRGIKSWTFSDTKTDEEIADLNADIATMLARKIYELSKPPEDQKNV